VAERLPGRRGGAAAHHVLIGPADVRGDVAQDDAVHGLLGQALALRHVGRHLELRRLVVLDDDPAGLLVDDDLVSTHV
jgi:hypothetical protein